MKITDKGREEQKKRESKMRERKPYSRPELIELGSLQQITLGSPSIGTNDSGNPTQYKYNP